MTVHKLTTPLSKAMEELEATRQELKAAREEAAHLKCELKASHKIISELSMTVTRFTTSLGIAHPQPSCSSPTAEAAVLQR